MADAYLVKQLQALEAHYNIAQLTEALAAVAEERGDTAQQTLLSCERSLDADDRAEALVAYDVFAFAFRELRRASTRITKVITSGSTLEPKYRPG